MNCRLWTEQGDAVCRRDNHKCPNFNIQTLKLYKQRPNGPSVPKREAHGSRLFERKRDKEIRQPSEERLHRAQQAFSTQGVLKETWTSEWTKRRKAGQKRRRRGGKSKRQQIPLSTLADTGMMRRSKPTTLIYPSNAG